MNIETLLDYQAIIANRPAPVHLALRFTAPELLAERSRPIAFCVVLDRSGSMSGARLAAAKEACRLVVRNLRKDDRFALVAFDTAAETVVHLQTVGQRTALLHAIDQVRVGGSTNLSAGWMLGRDQLRAAPADMPRRVLLLTDGQLNCGIVEPGHVRQLVAGGLEMSGVRTSCLGFGEDYAEDLLADLSLAAGGAYYDANLPDKLPEIFQAELEGLQRVAVQNLRVRFKRLMFCEGIEPLSPCPVTRLPDDRIEALVGDLMSDEERVLVVRLDTLALPLLPSGEAVASLEGELLVELEVLYDEISDTGVVSREWRQQIRVRAVQDEAEITRNELVIPWVVTQQASQAVNEAIRLADLGQNEQACRAVNEARQRVERDAPGVAGADARRLLQEAADRLSDPDGFGSASRKAMRYSSRFMSKMSSSEHWTQESPAPSFSRRRRQADPQPPAAQGDSTDATGPTKPN
jgi:Ca-activated chloride channel homolog